MATHPEHIGPYRVLRPIAQGGMAEVFEVEDPASGECLALKLLMNLKVALKRFNREYEAMARLNHPGVVRVYHYGLHQGRPWLTMELLQGQNAHHWVKAFGSPDSPGREAEVLRLGYHLATALAYCHDRGLVHRDLKSANVVVLPDARVKLVDFGTAHLVDAAERITTEGEFVGTFAYASPEQLQDDKVSPRSDLYSLGVLLYRLATGRRPFGARDPAELAWQHLNEPPPHPKAHAPAMSDALAQLILQLLAKKPEDRPAHASQVAAALERMAGTPFGTLSQVALHREHCTTRRAPRTQLWKRLERKPQGDWITVVGDAGSDRARFLQDVSGEAWVHNWSPWSVTLRPDRDVAMLTRLMLSLAKGLDAHPGVPEALTTLRQSSRLEVRGRPEARTAIQVAAAALAEARHQTEGFPLLFVISEGQHLGTVGIELLSGLRRELKGRQVPSAVVIGVGTHQLDPRGRVGRLIEDAWRLPMDPLSPARIAASTGVMLGCRPPPAHVAHALERATHGQPLYLEQVLSRLVSTADIEAEDNRIAWADQQLDIVAPPSAVADAQAILAQMPPSHRRVLEAVVVADCAPIDVLSHLLEWHDQPAVVTVIEALQRVGAVVWEADRKTAPRVGHPALAPAINAMLPLWRRARLQARLAQAVSEASPTAMGVLALVRAGRPVEAAKAAGPVARELYESQEVRSALEVLEPVVRGLTGVPVPATAEIGEVYLLHGLCLQAVNPAHGDTARTLRVAAHLITRPPAMVAQVQMAKATLARCIGHYRNYRRGVDDALALLGPDDPPDVRAAMLIERGNAQRLHGSLKAAHKSYVEAEQIARKIRVMKLLARATVGIAACHVYRGDLSEGERQASRAMAQLERLGDHQGFWEALAVWGEAVRRQARFSEVLSVLYQRAPEARNHEDSRGYAAMLLTITWCEVDLERLGRAQEWVDELRAIAHKGEHLHTRLRTGLAHGRILLASGQRRQAAYVLQDVERRARAAELKVEAEQARAMHGEALWFLGDREGSRACYQSAILGLMGLGVQPALADAVVSRGRGPGREVSETELFDPVRRWLEEQAPPLVKLEKELAGGAYARRKGDRVASKNAYRTAALVLNRLATQLNDTDRAALRVHRWSRRIRRGLRQA